MEKYVVLWKLKWHLIDRVWEVKTEVKEIPLSQCTSKRWGLMGTTDLPGGYLVSWSTKWSQ